MFRNLLKSFAAVKHAGTKKVSGASTRAGATGCVASKQLFNQTPVQAYFVSKRPAMYKHHCLRFTHSLDALQTPKSFSQRWPRRYAELFECRNATTFCHSQHANALFPKELGTWIKSIFYSLLTLGDFANSSPQQKLDIAGGCATTSPYITSKKLWSKAGFIEKA